MKIAEIIKSIRLKSLLSQSDFAKEIGVSFATVNRWENGKTVPRISKIKQISEFCLLHGIPFNAEELAKMANVPLAETE